MARVFYLLHNIENIFSIYLRYLHLCKIMLSFICTIRIQELENSAQALLSNG